MVASDEELNPGAETGLWPVCDFHTHTILSDGVLAPIELIRRAVVAGYQGLGISDHSGLGGLERRIRELAADCRLARERWDFPCFPGVELTHVPASAVAELAALARRSGAVYVVVHGETLVEPTEPGTNLSAVSCPNVDLLAHPGLLTEEEARLAAENEVFVEISAKPGHSLGNGRVAAMARKTGAKLLVGSDLHEPSQFLTPPFVRSLLLAAGLEEGELAAVTRDHTQQMLERLRRREEAKEA
ncbi:MAG TPA: histidinol phosphate phosphatase domain-containing protein [Armatimonadota bacterium]|jgi:histidinol phosphatase-like PHP family hydrolase